MAQSEPPGLNLSIQGSNRCAQRKIDRPKRSASIKYIPSFKASETSAASGHTCVRAPQQLAWTFYSGTLRRRRPPLGIDWGGHTPSRQ